MLISSIRLPAGSHVLRTENKFWNIAVIGHFTVSLTTKAFSYSSSSEYISRLGSHVGQS